MSSRNDNVLKFFERMCGVISFPIDRNTSLVQYVYILLVILNLIAVNTLAESCPTL